MRLEELEGAREDYDRALELDPDVAGTWCNRGVVRSLLGDTKGALADFSRAVALDPSLADGYAGRLQVLVDLGRRAEAARDLARLVELDPHHPVVAPARAALGGPPPEEAR